MNLLSGVSLEERLPYLSHTLLLDLSYLKLTDWQLAVISSDNDSLRLELTAKGELVVKPLLPAIKIGWQAGQLALQLYGWSKQDGTGVALGPSAGYRLPNGAVYAPSVSWMPRERWEGWLSGQKVKGGTREEERYEGEYNARDDVFVNFSPDFFIELVSHSDSLGSLQRKMEEYLENGSRLGWLVDPIQRRTHIYRPGQPAEVLEDPATVSGEPVLPGFELNVREIW